MKRLYAVILLVLLLVPALCLPVLAQHESANPSIKIYDFTGTLTDSEVLQLEEQAQAIVERLSVDIGVVMVDSTGALSAEAYADDFFDYNGFGSGSGADGMMLLVSLEYRDVHITTHGKAQRIFYDSDIERLLDSIVDDLSAGRYARAYQTFLSNSEKHLAQSLLPYRERTPLPQRLGVAAAVGMVVSGIVMGVIVLMHKKSLAPATDTAHYLGQNGFAVTHRKDQFVHTYTSRTPIPKSSGSGGGGGSAHRSSSGRMHGGGRRF